MKISIIVPTCGRLNEMNLTMSSLGNAWPKNYVDPDIVIVDDSQNNVYNTWLLDKFEKRIPNCRVARADESLGFYGAIQRAWDEIDTRTDFVFHLEDDFIFHGRIPIYDMLRILDRNPHLAQVALKRQPVNKEERRAGGICEQWPDQYHDQDIDGLRWTEHDLFFTTNVCLYRYALTRLGWPQQAGSEQAFTQICRDAGYRFAFYGHKFDPPRIHHIGDRRTGRGY